MPDGCFSLPLFLATLQYVQGLPPNNILTISASLPGMLIFQRFKILTYSYGTTTYQFCKFDLRCVFIFAPIYYHITAYFSIKMGNSLDIANCHITISLIYINLHGARACLKIKKYTKHLFTASFHDKIKKKGADIMLRRYELTDQEWEQVAALLPPEKTGKPGRPSKDNRTMLNGMVWIARSGAPWRDLPERYGSWNSVYSRFRKWIDDGILDNIFRVLSLEAELYELSLDATIVQAHQHSAGAKKGGLQTRLDTAGEAPVPKFMQP